MDPPAEKAGPMDMVWSMEPRTGSWTYRPTEDMARGSIFQCSSFQKWWFMVSWTKIPLLQSLVDKSGPMDRVKKVLQQQQMLEKKSWKQGQGQPNIGTKWIKHPLCLATDAHEPDLWNMWSIGLGSVNFACKKCSCLEEKFRPQINVELNCWICSDQILKFWQMSFWKKK